MSKLLLISVVVAMVAIPAFAARDPHPARGLRKALLFTFAFDVVYITALRFVFPRL